MPKKVHRSESKIYLKSFLGAKISRLQDFMKLLLRSTPNHFLSHVGTNDLNSNKPSEVLQKTSLTLQLHERITNMTLVGLILSLEEITRY